MKEKVKKKKRPMSLKKKIILIVLAVVAVIALIYIAYYLIHYTLYRGYEKYVSSYEYEEGKELQFLTDSDPSVEGFKLVAENDYLKLYTDTATTYVAVYDKRTGVTTYSNPLNADDDKTAKTANKNYLKSQLIVTYYGETASSQATMDNYSKSISLGQYTYEGIENGVRYIYSIGDATSTVNEETGAVTEGNYFEIPLEYRLDGDSLKVSIPTSAIKEHGLAYLNKIQFLRYMGAASDEETGYIVVPNGSGSLINFNNGKTDTSYTYGQYIYEIDPLNANYTTLENLKAARLPIFAICSDNRDMLAEVTSGETIATISANVSGTFNDYNFVYPSFVVRNADDLVMFGNASSETKIMEEDFYDVKLEVTYSFMTEDYKGYSGIANYYREKLIANGTLTPITESGDIPFYYDIISGVKETGHFLGVQYLHVFSMTTFDEAEEIAQSLLDSGISNQVMNLQGWFNGGYYQNAAHNIKVIGKLGGKSGLEDLNAYMKSIGGKLYADVSFQKVSTADSGYNSSAESARYYGGGYVASFGLLDPSTLRNTASLGYSENRYYLLSPKFLDRYVTKFAKKIQNYDVDGISLRDLANTLTSDKKRTNITTREDALDIVEAMLGVLEDTNKNIMTSDANAYAFAYSDDIINVPMKGNEFFIVDEQIPLYQMIIHGCIEYSTTLLDDVNNYNINNTYLQMIETGTAPHYNFTYDEANEMKLTALNRFYSTTFATQKEDALATYTAVNAALKYVRNANIIKHEIDGDLRAVTYSNGVVIYVNYGSKDGTINGVTVPANSYRVEGV